MMGRLGIDSTYGFLIHIGQTVGLWVFLLLLLLVHSGDRFSHLVAYTTLSSVAGATFYSFCVTRMNYWRGVSLKQHFRRQAELSGFEVSAVALSLCHWYITVTHMGVVQQEPSTVPYSHLTLELWLFLGAGYEHFLWSVK